MLEDGMLQILNQESPIIIAHDFIVDTQTEALMLYMELASFPDFIKVSLLDEENHTMNEIMSVEKAMRVRIDDSPHLTLMQFEQCSVPLVFKQPRNTLVVEVGSTQDHLNVLALRLMGSQ